MYEILRAMGQPVIAPLLKMLRNESDFSVPGVGLLSEIAENPENLDTLIAALRNDYSNLTLTVYYVLSEIGEVAIDKLISALGEKESSWAIVRVLAVGGHDNSPTFWP